MRADLNGALSILAGLWHCLA